MKTIVLCSVVGEACSVIFAYSYLVTKMKLKIEMLLIRVFAAAVFWNKYLTLQKEPAIDSACAKTKAVVTDYDHALFSYFILLTTPWY